MLPEIGSFNIVNGDLYLDCRMVGINAVTNANFDSYSGNIVYEIVVKYYEKDNTASTDKSYIKVAEETFYSERLYGSEVSSFSQIVDSSFVNSNYDYFTFSVTTLGALHANEGDRNAIKTLEGTYICLEYPVYYGPNEYYTSASYGQHVLRSTTLTSPMKFTRTKSPYFAKDES